MKIHEHQAKAILARSGVAVPRGVLVRSGREALDAYNWLGTPVGVVKAQVHAGGRGKGGGVRVVGSAAEAREAAEQILGKPLVTPQTGPSGVPVRKLLVEEGLEIRKEVYAGITIDRRAGAPVFIACAEGGVEIEEVAAQHPERILRAHFGTGGLEPYQARRIFFELGLEPGYLKSFAATVTALARVFLDDDCSLAEVNPLVLSRANQVVALDAKLNFDDNAIDRHQEIAGMRDLDEEDPAEWEAAQAGLSYVNLDGNIGCLVNGAGLAMATMDIIKHHGGAPANFLDVGGGATAEQVERAFQLILADPAVEAILVNIFGGIMRCDTIAEGICAAAKEVNLEVPLVVRLEGTKVEEGRRILAGSGLALTAAGSLEEAAMKVVAAVA